MCVHTGRVRFKSREIKVLGEHSLGGRKRVRTGTLTVKDNLEGLVLDARLK